MKIFIITPFPDLINQFMESTMIKKAQNKELLKYETLNLFDYTDHPHRNIDDYPGKSLQAKAIMLMIQNNLNHSVAQHPNELITYGGNGSVFQNWAQYLLCMQYLAEMTNEQTRQWHQATSKQQRAIRNKQ